MSEYSMTEDGYWAKSVGLMSHDDLPYNKHCSRCNDSHTDKVYTDDYDSYEVTVDDGGLVAKYYKPGDRKIEDALHTKYVQQMKIYEDEQKKIAEWAITLANQKRKSDEYVRKAKLLGGSAQNQNSGRVNRTTENSVKSGGFVKELPPDAFASEGEKVVGNDSGEEKKITGTLMTPHKCVLPEIWDNPNRHSFGRKRLVPLHSVFKCAECNKSWIVANRYGMEPSYDEWHHPSWYQLQHWWRIYKATVEYASDPVTEK